MMSKAEWALVSDMAYAILNLLVRLHPNSELIEARRSIQAALVKAEQEHASE